MDLQLEGKRALITGSTAGIGYAIAESLVQEGAAVIVNGRTKQRVDAAVEKLRGRSSAAQIDSLSADLGTAAAVQQAIRQFPEVDILINNLGIFEPKPFEEISDEDWFRFFEVNVLSGVRLSRYHLTRMKSRN